MITADSPHLEMVFFHFILLVEKSSDSESWIPPAESGGMFPGTAVFTKCCHRDASIHAFPHLRAIRKSIAYFSVWP